MDSKILGVNIDHFATLRNAREDSQINIIEISKSILNCNVDHITCHLREDRRHILDQDVFDLSRYIGSDRINLEMALTSEMLSIASKVKPLQCTLVPERREEQTTESGLNISDNNLKKISNALDVARFNGFKLSIFVDPDIDSIKKLCDIGIDKIEINTGQYSTVCSNKKSSNESFLAIKDASQFAQSVGIDVAAGHGLDLNNINKLLSINEIVEYNIGYSIVSNSLIYGAERASLDFVNKIKC